MKILKVDIEKVDDLMSRDKLTYNMLAENAGISLRVVFRLKSNPTHFSTKIVNRIARALGVDTTEILTQVEVDADALSES